MIINTIQSSNLPRQRFAKPLSPLPRSSHSVHFGQGQRVHQLGGLIFGIFAMFGAYYAPVEGRRLYKDFTSGSTQMDSPNQEREAKLLQQAQNLKRRMTAFNIPALVQKITPSTAELIQPNGTTKGSIIWFTTTDGQLWILTNHHVVCEDQYDEGSHQYYPVLLEDKPMTIRLYNGNDFQPAQTVQAMIAKDFAGQPMVSGSHDIAVLKVTTPNFTLPSNIHPVTFRDLVKDPLQAGEPVIAVGAARGLPDSVSHGIITNTERQAVSDTQNPLGETLDEPDNLFINVDAPINSGNSGGLLADGQGFLIGMNTGATQNADGQGFSIRGDIILKTLEDFGLKVKLQKADVSLVLPTNDSKQTIVDRLSQRVTDLSQQAHQLATQQDFSQVIDQVFPSLVFIRNEHIHERPGILFQDQSGKVHILAQYDSLNNGRSSQDTTQEEDIVSRQYQIHFDSSSGNTETYTAQVSTLANGQKAISRDGGITVLDFVGPVPPDLQNRVHYTFRDLKTDPLEVGEGLVVMNQGGNWLSTSGFGANLGIVSNASRALPDEVDPDNTAKTTTQPQDPGGFMHYLQTDAALHNEANGSPVFDRNGRLIGIIFKKDGLFSNVVAMMMGGQAPTFDGVNVALRVDDILKTLNTWGMQAR
jgi:S1-C subfamily serine protease